MEVQSLSGHLLPVDPTSPLQATTRQYVDRSSVYPPDQHVLLSWTKDPLDCTSTVAASSGRLVIARLRFPVAGTIARLYWCMGTAATSAGTYSGVAIYNDAGSKLGQSANAGTSFLSSGVKSALLQSTVSVTADYYYLGVLFQGSGSGMNYLATGATNYAALPGTPRGRDFTGQTGFPATLNVAEPANFGFVVWMAAAAS